MIGSGVAIGTQLFDLNGHVELVGITNPGELRVDRRVNSTPTLDGRSFVSDTGYSDTDRVFDYAMRGRDKAYVDNLVRIAKLHSRLVLCNDEGAFVVIIKSVFYVNGTLRMSFVTVGAA